MWLVAYFVPLHSAFLWSTWKTEQKRVFTLYSTFKAFFNPLNVTLIKRTRLLWCHPRRSLGGKMFSTCFYSFFSSGFLLLLYDRVFLFVFLLIHCSKTIRKKSIWFLGKSFVVLHSWMQLCFIFPWKDLGVWKPSRLLSVFLSRVWWTVDYVWLLWF